MNLQLPYSQSAEKRSYITVATPLTAVSHFCLFRSPDRHTQRTVCTVAGTGVKSQGRGNDLQGSVVSVGIITGPDLWQDTSQQLPTRPGPKLEGWKVFFIDTVPKKQGQ